MLNPIPTDDVEEELCHMLGSNYDLLVRVEPYTYRWCCWGRTLPHA